jgi:hypothetical protein
LSLPLLVPLSPCLLDSLLSSDSVEANSRLASSSPSAFGVNELDVVYGAVVAAQINGARLAAGGDSLPDIDLFIAAVGVMNDHAVKLNRRAFDSDLNSLEPAAPAAYLDSVTIHSSVHAGLSQKNPTTTRLRLRPPHATLRVSADSGSASAQDQQ